ncbi:diaminopimelate decarboxylase [Fructilactobacillus myrtifloralis]|uniref:Diaminopimelate decarboxylase n=1 Tax=Fructilactobacillus myrtifloralis TaxID=2940301 RepID=A0ABY5BNY5_9LACO|nr:diaminopimelate decarboxylase [Fructilactobacillus myrtifloralis]USS84681.1 diaminopimelate decarboxylase [Fructilactobacillus myrtifloralis]
MLSSDEVRNNQLLIGGIPATELADEYGTPLQVYDVAKIRHQIRAFERVFVEQHVDYAVSYASKAFACVAMYQIVNQEHAHIDVVSAGELATALAADFPMERVSFHGNNKSYEELQMAVHHHVGTIILDNFYEIGLLAQVLEAADAEVNVMLRVSPAVSAHTHEFIQTGQQDSKFGFDLLTGQADQALQQVLAEPRMHLQGVHSHIGSQIFATDGFKIETQKLVHLMQHWRDEYDYIPQVVNVGGGFGIQYTDADHPIRPEEFVEQIITTLKTETAAADLPLPAVWIEPGRSIAGPAGVSLYRVGSQKTIPEVRKYVAVDGGMGDNIRPALYGAAYEAVAADNVAPTETEVVTVAGKYCESGDILVKDAKLPPVQAGDVIAVLATGAYGYSMASNYNRNPRPAVVFVENGSAQVVVKRETLADLTRLDVKLSD